MYSYFKDEQVSILSTEKVSHAFNDRWLFKEIHFAVQKGDRVALVGVNGTGKSTLLRILAEELQPQEGRVVKERGIQIGYLPQQPEFNYDQAIRDYIYSADDERQQLIREYDQLVDNQDFTSDNFHNLTAKLTHLDAWEYEQSFKQILGRFQIENLHQTIGTLSGGQRKRLALAKLLIDEPDVFILDEPTNHLDIETIEWLEKLLISKNRTVIVVSHDRYFLDQVCTEIHELDQGKIYNYRGNYAYFLEKKNERETMLIASADKARNLWRKELEWMRRQPQARGTKAKARIESFYDLEEKSKGPMAKEKLSLSVDMTRQGKKILELMGISFRTKNKEIISSFSYVFKKSDRIGLAGKNGSGKTTFLNLITGALPPSSGTVNLGETTRFGYYKQEGLQFNSQDRVIDIVKNVAEYIELKNGEQITASQLLTQFLFPPNKQFGLVEKLSGGEKKRLHLLRILMANPNFLILDEPSNDLDIDTLNVLEEFLEEFPGVLILVSHDRYLLDKLTDQLFIFTGSGDITIYNGNYADFKLEQEQSIKSLKESEPKNTAPEKTVSKKTLTYKEQIEFKDLGTEIEFLERSIEMHTYKLSETDDHLKLTELAKVIEELKNTLDKKTDRWLVLSEFA